MMSETTGGAYNSPAIKTPRVSTQQPCPLKISVLAHRTDGQGSSYADHMFVVSVQCEPDVSYVVERSYVDFVDLDNSLRKTFPSIMLRDLPLTGAPTVAKYLQYRTYQGRDSAKPAMMGRSYHTVADSVGPHAIAAMELYCRGSKENLSSKLQSLNEYLKEVISINEMVVSEAFADFISEEGFSLETGERVPLIVEASEIDVLLADAVLVDCVVKYAEAATFTVQPGQLVVWKFSTVDYDIGFSVEFNGEAKVALTRYRSHVNPVAGCLRCDAFGTCELKWDNTYSKFYNKNLRWAVRIVSTREYEAACRDSQEMQRERRRLDKQRAAIHAALVKHAAEVSGVIHASAASPSQSSGGADDEEGNRLRKKAAEELQEAQGKIQHTIDELIESKTTAEAMAMRLEKAERTIEALTELNQKSRLREDLLRKENEQLITENDNLTRTIEEQSSELLDFEKQIAALNGRVTAFDRDMADKDAMVAKAELAMKYLRESLRVVRTSPDTLEPAAVNEVEISALLDKMASLELEASACRAAHVTLCEQLSSAKSETADLATELIDQTQREEEMKNTIEVLTDQLNAALKALSTGSSHTNASMKGHQLSKGSEQPLRRHSTAEAMLQARGAALRMRYGSWDIAAPPSADEANGNDILLAQLHSSAGQSQPMNNMATSTKPFDTDV